MKKALFLIIVLSLLLPAGCSALPETETGSQTALATLTPTPSATASPSPTLTPCPTPTPMPVMTPLPVPTPVMQEVARFYADLNGDGEDETIVISTVNEEDEIIDAVTLEVLDVPESRICFTDCVSFAHAYLTSTPAGYPCVLISCYGECGENMTYICSFNGLAPVFQNEVYEIIRNVDGTSLMMRSYVETVGDWWYTREYALTDDFMLEPVSDMMIDTKDREPLCTSRDLPVEMLAGGEYKADTLPADTLIWPVTADGEGHMTFQLEDGRTGRITYTRDDDGYTLIDGTNVDEYFGYIEYWG